VFVRTRTGVRPVAQVTVLDLMKGNSPIDF